MRLLAGVVVEGRPVLKRVLAGEPQSSFGADSSEGLRSEVRP
jgi:hypothetical protein